MRGALITIRCDCGGVGLRAARRKLGLRRVRPELGHQPDPGRGVLAIMREMRQSRLRVMAVAVALTIALLVLVPLPGRGS